MEDNFSKINYNELSHFQVGRIGEYWVKFHLTLMGLDVYTSEVDDKGIDFIVRLNDVNYIDIQVKTIRSLNSYVYIDKRTKAWQKPFKPNLYLALVILRNENWPATYLIPATVWNEPNQLFVSRDYIGSTKSMPDWGLNLSKKNLGLLSEYELNKIVASLKTP